VVFCAAKDCVVEMLTSDGRASGSWYLELEADSAILRCRSLRGGWDSGR